MSVPTLQQLIEEQDSKKAIAKIIIGGTELPIWTSCTYQFEIGQVPTATIIVPGLANLPASVQEEAAVQIFLGYQSGVTALTRLVFGGAIVDSVGNNGSEISIVCVMDGPRKLSYSYNRRIAFDFDNVTAEEAVTALLELAGVSNYAVNLDPWLIGTVVPYTSALGNQIQFSSYGDAVNKVAEVDGTPWFALPTGQVRVEDRDPVPSPSARRTYFTSILTGPVETQPSGITNPAARPRITDISKNKSRRDVANFIEVDGAVVVTLGPNGEQNSDQIKETVDGLSGQFPNGAYWIPTPPLFQDFNFSNELIDTNAKAFEVCERYFDLKNRLFEELPITVPGDPDVFLCETVEIKDPVYSGTSSLYFVKGYSTTIDQNSCTTQLNLTGGPEAGTIGFAAPFSEFTWTYDAFRSSPDIRPPGGKDNPLDLPPDTNIGAKLCEDFPTQEDTTDAADTGGDADTSPPSPETDNSSASDTGGKAVVYIGFDGTQSQDFDGFIVSWIWHWTDHLSVVHTVSGPRWTLIIDPEEQSSVEVELIVTDNTGRTDTIIKTVRTSVNSVSDPTNPDQPYDPTDGSTDTGNGGGSSIGPCSTPEFPNPYGSDTPQPGGCEGLQKTFFVAAKTVAMASLDNRTWNDLTKASAGASGDFISVDAGVNNDNQESIGIFGTTAGEIVRTVDNCVTGEVVFTIPGVPRIECIHFDREEMGTPGGDIPEASEAPSNGQVPVYTQSNPGTLTIAQAYQQCRLVGFSHNTAIVAVAIMVRESGLFSAATNTAGNTPPSTDRGIAQWNSFYHPDISDTCAYNTQCAITQMFKKSSGGSDFSPWNVRGGSYLTGTDLSAVQAIVGNLSGGGISLQEPNFVVAPSSLRVWAGTSDGRIFSSEDSGKTWSIYKDFGDGYPILQLGTPPRYGAQASSLWAFGGDTANIDTLIRIDATKTKEFVPLFISGALRTAIQVAGSGASVRSSMNDTASIIVFDNSVVTERVWTNSDPLGKPDNWTPCGITSDTYNTVASGFEGEFVIAGSGVRVTKDNENFENLGAGPGTINQMIWRGLPGMYTAALDAGLYQSVSFGDSFGALRPNADFGTTWPAGAQAKQVAISIGARACLPPTPPFCFGDPVPVATLANTASIGALPITTQTLTVPATWTQNTRFMLSIFQESVSETPNIPTLYNAEVSPGNNDLADYQWSLVKTVVINNFRLSLFTVAIDITPVNGSVITALFDGQAQRAVNMVLDEVGIGLIPTVAQNNKYAKLTDQIQVGLQPFKDPINDLTYAVAAARVVFPSGDSVSVLPMTSVTYSNPNDGSTYFWDCITFQQAGQNLLPTADIAPASVPVEMMILAVELAGCASNPPPPPSDWAVYNYNDLYVDGRVPENSLLFVTYVDTSGGVVPSITEINCVATEIYNDTHNVTFGTWFQNSSQTDSYAAWIVVPTGPGAYFFVNGSGALNAALIYGADLSDPIDTTIVDGGSVGPGETIEVDLTQTVDADQMMITGYAVDIDGFNGSLSNAPDDWHYIPRLIYYLIGASSGRISTWDKLDQDYFGHFTRNDGYYVGGGVVLNPAP